MKDTIGVGVVLKDEWAWAWQTYQARKGGKASVLLKIILEKEFIKEGLIPASGIPKNR